MVFYTHIYKADKTEQSELLLNGITIEEKPENLTILLNEKSISKTTTAKLTTNSEIFSAITVQKYESAGNQMMCNKVNELCIVKMVSECTWVSMVNCLHQPESRKWICYWLLIPS